MRSGVIAVLLTWAGAVAFGALPFVFAEQPLSLTDAVFELASGLTATGSTLHVGLDQMPRGILMWRFLLSWMGGFGLVTFAVLILPYLRVGGVQLFTVDLSARPGKFLPRTAEVVGQIARIYILLTLACTIAYAAAGMTTFDAVGHAMATVATAGVSSHDAGLGYFQSPAIEWIATLFMLLSAMPFVLYIYLLRGQVAPLFRDSQVRLFVSIILAGVVLLALWRLGGDATSIEQAFREAAFNVVSIISTTGFVSHDFHLWGGFASLLLLCAMLMGGCTGSTAGGIKMFRLAVLLEVLRAQIRRQILPSGVFHVHYNRQPIPNEIVTAVITYGFAYLGHVRRAGHGPGLHRPQPRREPGRIGGGAGQRRPGPRLPHRPVLHLRAIVRYGDLAAHLRHDHRPAGDPAVRAAVHPCLLAGVSFRRHGRAPSHGRRQCWCRRDRCALARRAA